MISRGTAPGGCDWSSPRPGRSAILPLLLTAAVGALAGCAPGGVFAPALPPGWGVLTGGIGTCDVGPPISYRYVAGTITLYPGSAMHKAEAAIDTVTVAANGAYRFLVPAGFYELVLDADASSEALPVFQGTPKVTSGQVTVSDLTISACAV